MNPNDKSNISYLFWLEEYKSNVTDIQTRVSLQHGLLNIQFIFVLGISAYFAKLFIDNPTLYINTTNRILLMFVPIIIALLSLRHLNHDVNIIVKAKYIYRVIRPRIIEIAGDNKLLGFEEFIDKARRSRAKRYGFSIWLGGDYIFHFVFLIFFIIGSFITFFFAPGKIIIASNSRELFLFAIQDILLLIDTYLLFEVSRLLFKIGIDYCSIISDYENEHIVKKTIIKFFYRLFHRRSEDKGKDTR